MVLRKVVLCCLAALIAVPLPAGTEETSPPPAGKTLAVYPGNHGFLHQTGYHVPYGWAAMYRIHSPGYFIEGQTSGGEPLPAGTYRYVFTFSLLAGQLGGLLKNADDVVRVEAWDATTHQCLMSRNFQVADFLPLGRKPSIKTLTFSTAGRAGHHFEPKIFWQGLSGVFLRRIELLRLQDMDPKKLASKAEDFEEIMGSLYLDRGFVVGRRLNGEIEYVGDAAIWTGMYAAAQAWRYKATHSPEALQRMQDSLWALHQLSVQAPDPGTLARFIYADGKLHPHAASKDTYTGFFLAAAQCLPLVKDKALRAALLADVDGLAGHFLDHDLAFIPRHGRSVDLSPSLSVSKISEAIEGLQHKPSERQRVIRLLEAVHFYFLIHAQKPWDGLARMIRNLKREDFAAVHRDRVVFLNGALQALQQLQRNVHRSAVLWKWKDAPYQKLDRLLLQMIEQLSVSSRPAIREPEELKFLASQSLHALHFLKIAGQLLPKPNRYERYYRENLWEHKALLKTVWEWGHIDEELIAAVAGETQAAVVRTSSGHLSYLALLDLVEYERDATLRKTYQAIFARQYQPEQADYNAMLHAMQPVFRMDPAQTGMAFWSLTLYPTDRQGKGEAYWQKHRRELGERYGGVVSGKARDPLPVNERQRDAFIWQRSARSIRGDDASQLYPPLDYLFAYWLLRSQGEIK